MTAPIRVQLSRRKDFHLAEAAGNGLPTVNVARPSRWGNPFNFSKSDYCWIALSFGCRGDGEGRRRAAVIAFREWIAPHPAGRLLSSERQVVIEAQDKKIPIGPLVTAGAAPSRQDIRRALGGKNLACWCPRPKPGEPDNCHAAVLLEIANAPTPA